MGQFVSIQLQCDDRNYAHLFPKTILVPKHKHHSYFYVHVKLRAYIIRKQQHRLLPERYTYQTVSFWNEEKNKECRYSREITKNEVLNVVFGEKQTHELQMKHGHWCDPDYAKWHREFSKHANT